MHGQNHIKQIDVNYVLVAFPEVLIEVPNTYRGRCYTRLLRYISFTTSRSTVLMKCQLKKTMNI